MVAVGSLLSCARVVVLLLDLKVGVLATTLNAQAFGVVESEGKCHRPYTVSMATWNACRDHAHTASEAAWNGNDDHPCTASVGGRHGSDDHPSGCSRHIYPALVMKGDMLFHDCVWHHHEN